MAQLAIETSEVTSSCSRERAPGRARDWRAARAAAPFSGERAVMITWLVGLAARAAAASKPMPLFAPAFGDLGELREEDEG